MKRRFNTLLSTELNISTVKKQNTRKKHLNILLYPVTRFTYFIVAMPEQRLYTNECTPGTILSITFAQPLMTETETHRLYLWSDGMGNKYRGTSTHVCTYKHTHTHDTHTHIRQAYEVSVFHTNTQSLVDPTL